MLISTNAQDTDSKVSKFSFVDLAQKEIGKLVTPTSQVPLQAKVAPTQEAKTFTEGEVSRIKEEAYQKGYDRGKADAEEASQEVIEGYKIEFDFAACLQALIQNEQLMANAHKVNIQNATMELTHHICRKLFATLPSDLELVLRQQLQRLIDHGYQDGVLRVRIHPDRKALCERLLQQEGNIQHVQIVEDPALEPSSCDITYDGATLSFDRKAIEEEIINIIQGRKS